MTGLLVVVVKQPRVVQPHLEVLHFPHPHDKHVDIILISVPIPRAHIPSLTPLVTVILLNHVQTTLRLLVLLASLLPPLVCLVNCYF